MSLLYTSSASAVGSTVSLATLISRLRVKYLPAEPFEDTFGGAQTSGATTITLTNIGKWAPNDILEAAADGEQERFVTAATPLTNPATVARAHGATTAVAHSNGDLVYRNPRFPYNVLSDIIENVATNETWPYMWVVSQVTITPSPTTTELYAITDAAFRNPIKAVQQRTGTITGVYEYPAVQVIHGLSTALSSSTMAIKMTSFNNTTNDVYVTYQAEITASTIPEGDVAEWILLRSAARVMRQRAVMAGGFDSQQPLDKATVATLVGQAAELDREAKNMRSRVQSVLLSKEYPQARWVNLA